MTDDEIQAAIEAGEVAYRNYQRKPRGTMMRAGDHNSAHWIARAVERAARAAEREACARVCEETTAAWTQPVYNSACMDCATAIRNRAEGQR